MGSAGFTRPRCHRGIEAARVVLRSSAFLADMSTLARVEASRGTGLSIRSRPRLYSVGRAGRGRAGDVMGKAGTDGMIGRLLSGLAGL
jgi:hypothetical protein